jgi:hypothetical protein
LAISEREGMSRRNFSDEERPSAQHNRRESRRRLAEEASVAVDRLLADAGLLPSWALAHANKARQGRSLSLVALKCGDCSGWQKAEIAGCTVTSCTLHPLRPYHD